MPTTSPAVSRPSKEGLRPPVLVVGAGARSLTFALRLARAGRPVLVVERSSAVGGQARSYRYRGFTFDVGLHAFVSRTPAVLDFAASVLGRDQVSFYPRAASRLEGGAIVEDASTWTSCDGARRFFDLWPAGPEESWNCMAVGKPLKILYPREGGFGRLSESMAEEIERRGGRVRLNARVEPSDFSGAGGRLTSAVVAGQRVAVEGCYWGGAGQPSDDPEGPALALYHFGLEGPAPVPYHWVRLYDAGSPLLPRLVYYPARFSSRNAPAGCHSLGAVVPLPAADAAPKAARGLLSWARTKPEDFAGLVREDLEKSGLLRAESMLFTRTELLPLPWRRRRGRTAPSRWKNLWRAHEEPHEQPLESGVPLQIAGALADADRWLAS